jgi:hypothetical protein
MAYFRRRIPPLREASLTEGTSFSRPTGPSDQDSLSHADVPTPVVGHQDAHMTLSVHSVSAFDEDIVGLELLDDLLG